MIGRRDYVYGLFRPDNGQVFYIGMGRSQRAYEHQRDRRRKKTAKNALICKMVDRLGFSEIPVVFMRTGLKHQEACDLEIALIYALGRTPNGPLLNVVSGGEGLKDPTEDFRTRHATLMRKVLSRPEVRQRMKMSALKRDRTGEWEAKRRARMADTDVREKMSASAKARVRDPEHEARRLALAHSPEARAKRSVAMKGRPSPLKGRSPSDATRAKMRLAKLGKAPWNKGYLVIRGPSHSVNGNR
jgi:hypothetical protein